MFRGWHARRLLAEHCRTSIPGGCAGATLDLSSNHNQPKSPTHQTQPQHHTMTNFNIGDLPVDPNPNVQAAVSDSQVQASKLPVVTSTSKRDRLSATPDGQATAACVVKVDDAQATLRVTRRDTVRVPASAFPYLPFVGEVVYVRITQIQGGLVATPTESGERCIHPSLLAWMWPHELPRRVVSVLRSECPSDVEIGSSGPPLSEKEVRRREPELTPYGVGELFAGRTFNAKVLQAVPHYKWSRAMRAWWVRALAGDYAPRHAARLRVDAKTLAELSQKPLREWTVDELSGPVARCVFVCRRL